MALTLNTLKPAKGSKVKRFRLGRGEGSGSGKTSGKGTKGQRARSGGRNKLKMKGIRAMLLSFPKMRGFQSRYLKASTINLEKVAKAFGSDEKITLRLLKTKGLATKSATRAKLVGGNVDKALHFVNVMASEPAKAAVVKAGGSFVLEGKKKPRTVKKNKARA
ncbi:50S ribosomal protein L15 [Candidatus Uhrbacteria bacterium]|nr:50S ribosomal protein L15 [Candidatus Uhrbacteria bacterium]